MMTIIFFLIILLKTTLIDLILQLKSDKKEEGGEIDQESVQDIEARSQRTLTKSYKL